MAEKEKQTCEDCQCDLSEEDIENDYKNTNDELVCEDCSSSYCTCYECNNLVHEDYSCWGDDNVYCEDCYGEIFTTCYQCGTAIRIDESREYNDLHYCEDCFNEEFFCCYSCNEAHSIDNMYSNDNGCYCEDCYRYEEENSSYIHDYNYKPSLMFRPHYTQNKDFFGFELEVENKGNNSSSDIAEHITDNFEGLFFCKHDGSLDNGFEIVSHPMTFEFIQSKYDLFKNLLSYLRNNSFQSYTPGSCGFHVHISKDSFTTFHLYKFIKFVVNNSPFMITISQRTERQINDWCRLFYDEGNGDEYNKVSTIAKQKKTYNKMYAVNLQPSNTVELRILRGTLHYKSFIKNLEFVKCLFDFTKTTSNDNINVQSFIQYIHDNNSQFKMLYEYIQQDRFANYFPTNLKPIIKCA